MKKFGKTECPYCGRKVGLISAWLLKTQGEYRCPQCGGICNIVMSGGIYGLGAAAILLSVVFFLVHLLLIRLFSWLSLALVCSPFVLFFLLSPLFVRLQTPPVRRRSPNGRKVPAGQRLPAEPERRYTRVPPEQRGTRPEEDPMERTIRMEPIGKR